jgi:hypothetical protein
MSVSHGYNTIGGIEYDGGGCVEKTKKEKVSHQLGKLMGYGDAHQSISMQVSRDCHAMDALEL